MTNEQAIAVFKNMIRSNNEHGNTLLCIGEVQALDMAIEALEVGHAQCNDCHYRYHWMTQRMNGQNGGATA